MRPIETMLNAFEQALFSRSRLPFYVSTFDYGLSISPPSMGVENVHVCAREFATTCIIALAMREFFLARGFKCGSVRKGSGSSMVLVVPVGE